MSFVRRMDRVAVIACGGQTARVAACPSRRDRGRRGLRRLADLAGPSGAVGGISKKVAFGTGFGAYGVEILA